MLPARLRRLAAATPALLWFCAVAPAAEPDFAALQRERGEIERRYDREEQKISQAREQALIPVNARRRELEAAANRATMGGVNLGAYAVSGGTEGVDLAKLEQAHFERLEAGNLADHQLEPEAAEKFQAQSDALARRRTLELAKLDTRMLPDGEGMEKLRAQLIRKAELEAKWSERSDALQREEQRARHALELERTTAINRAEAAIAVAGQKLAVAVTKKLKAEMQAGRAPDPTAYATAINQLPPELLAKRDELKNALETAREELRAKFRVRRDELDNGRTEELAKAEG